jgi:hypothetical protein
MNVVKILHETRDTVTVRRSDWTRLLSELESAQDRSVVAQRRRREAAMGREAVRRHYLTAQEARHLLDGKALYGSGGRNADNLKGNWRQPQESAPRTWLKLRRAGSPAARPLWRGWLVLCRCQSMISSSGAPSKPGAGRFKADHRTNSTAEARNRGHTSSCARRGGRGTRPDESLRVKTTKATLQPRGTGSSGSQGDSVPATL